MEQRIREEIRKAYYSIALKCHPDRNKGNVSKVERFVQAAKAYRQLTYNK